MNQATSNAGQAVEDLARRLATRQAESLQRYGAILTRFGSAKMSSRDLGENLYKLAVEETARAVGDAVQLGVGYWRGVFGAVTPSASEKAPAVRSKAKKKKAAPRRSR